MISKFIW